MAWSVTWGSSASRGQVLELLLHDLGATNRPVKGGFVHDGPEPEWRVTGEYGLPAHAGFDQA